VIDIVSRTQCPQERRAERHKKANKKVWAGKAWKEARAIFLAENPRCIVCGDPSKVPHHPELSVYGKPEYLRLCDTKAYCTTCHRGEHRNYFQCRRCGKIRAKSEGELCYRCLAQTDQERVVFRREHRQRIRNAQEKERRQRFKEWLEVQHAKTNRA